MARVISNQNGCPTCEIQRFSRNHYFNGKLLVERDFTDEQRYYVDKARYHNQRLHGWGVVCGLKVKEHQNDLCRDRFVCVEPGSAVDCCGHDLIVHEEDCIDITTFESIKSLKAQNDRKPHVLQICLQYKECPTEDMPVLYDDCGCDETKCAPNRILESYEIGVILDPKPKSPPLHSPRFQWQNTLNLAHAARVALHAATERVYVMTADAPGLLYQLDAVTHAVITSHNLPAKGRALAVSNGGDRVYVVADPVAPAADQQLHVLDATSPGLPALQAASLTIANSAAVDVLMAVAPDGRLLTLVANNGDVLRWGADIDAPGAGPAQVVGNLGANLSALALSSDGTMVYAAGALDTIQVLTIATQAQSKINVLPPGAQISSLFTIKSSGSDILAVANQNGNTLDIIKPNPAALAGTIQLDQAPISIATSPGGHWSYVLERDDVANKSYIQAVDVSAALLQTPIPPTIKLEVSHPAQELVLAQDGEQLYIPFTGDLAQPVSGGVAIVEVSEDACSEIFWRHLEGCPHCDLPNCIVLATITDYHVGDKIVSAGIDNRSDRSVLASTKVLQDIIECLLEHGGGGDPGTQGPPGPNGAGIDDVVANIIPCDQIPAKPTLQTIAGQRTLTLEIPRGCDGKEAPPLPKVDLTHICAISWKHQGAMPVAGLRERPLLIAFDKAVAPGDLTEMSIRVLVSHEERLEGGSVRCWCEVPLKPLKGIQLREPCKINSDLVEPPTEINAALFQMTWVPNQGQICRVIVNGDLIRDEKNKRGLDANHLPPWLPARKTGDGVEGGTFESWFRVK